MRNKVYIVVLILYSVLILWEMFFGPYRTYNKEYNYNLFPLQTISIFINDYNEKNLNSFLINIIGNISFFIPFGWILPSVFKKMNAFYRLFLLTGIMIFFLEVLQMTLKVGMFDVDDIILNLLGISIGFIAYQFAMKKVCKLII